MLRCDHVRGTGVCVRVSFLFWPARKLAREGPSRRQKADLNGSVLRVLNKPDIDKKPDRVITI